MLEILASVKACTDKRLQTLEELVINHAALVSGCVCVFIAWDGPRQEFVKKLRFLGVPVLVFVVIEFEDPKPDAGVMRDDPENFHVLEMGRIGETLARLGD
jgi:hypothetical protein